MLLRRLINSNPAMPEQSRIRGQIKEWGRARLSPIPLFCIWRTLNLKRGRNNLCLLDWAANEYNKRHRNDRPSVPAIVQQRSDLPDLFVEPHGFTAVAPSTTLRRAEPSDPSAKAYGRRAEAYPPSPRLRRIPSFIPALTGEAFSASRRRVNLPPGLI